jgi:hypothetical protein
MQITLLTKGPPLKFRICNCKGLFAQEVWCVFSHRLQLLTPNFSKPPVEFHQQKPQISCLPEPYELLPTYPETHRLLPDS